MNRPLYIFSTRPGGDTITFPVPLEQPAEAADKVRESLVAAGCAGRDVILAIASGSCLCAAVGVHDLPGKDRLRALLYRLEEKVPVSAEDVVADFVSTSDGALGVCASAPNWRRLSNRWRRKAFPSRRFVRFRC